MQLQYDQPVPNNITQSFQNDPVSCPITELSEKCDRLIAEYQKQLQQNQKLKAAIENYEKEKLLLTRPQFFETEMSKLELTIRVYQQTLEELEQQSYKTLTQIQHPVSS
ncbi:hypothetical protein M9Y10_029009 [Tritrichomonas musculus]|uniref:Uncharacterized protein n=1 Tax=Tritrichomonas musculus TaxID=1915356 RepID=A0ABR2KKW9_9EUKA